MNLLDKAFHSIGAVLLDTLANAQAAEIDHLIDSMPVMLAANSFSRRARVARNIANQGYCAAKRLHFHGVRLHLIASRRAGQLPLPKTVWLREASVHDLTSVKQQRICLPNSTLFGDKAFCDAALKAQFKEQNTKLLVPKKKPKGKELTCFEKEQNRMISRFRQPVESFFNWLIAKTQIQKASQVRSTDGLLVHCFGKLTFALLLLISYY